MSIWVTLYEIILDLLKWGSYWCSSQPTYKQVNKICIILNRKKEERVREKIVQKAFESIIIIIFTRKHTLFLQLRSSTSLCFPTTWASSWSRSKFISPLLNTYWKAIKKFWVQSIPIRRIFGFPQFHMIFYFFSLICQNVVISSLFFTYVLPKDHSPTSNSFDLFSLVPRASTSGIQSSIKMG